MTTAAAPLTDAERAALSGKIAVVTGASRGIGYAVGELLGACGVHVVAVARTVSGLEDLDDAIRASGGPAPTLVPLDVRDGPGVDRLGAAIHERWGHLDIFVGNAGVLGQVSPLPHVKAKTWAETMDVNVSANWRLLRTLDPVLRKAPAARVVFVTSGLSDLAKMRPFYGPYQVSKAALDALAKTYEMETEGTAIQVELFNPGPVHTALRSKAVPGEKPGDVPAPRDVAPGLVRGLTA